MLYCQQCWHDSTLCCSFELSIACGPVFAGAWGRQGPGQKRWHCPLSIAAQDGHLGVVQYLLEQGADKDKTDNEGFSPLIVAAQEGHLAVVQYLLEHGANKNSTASDGSTHIFLAALNGHLAVVQYLLEQTEGADKDKVGYDGASPLWIAAANGYSEVVQFLLQHGADMSRAANDGHYPLLSLPTRRSNSFSVMKRNVARSKRSENRSESL